MYLPMLANNGRNFNKSLFNIKDRKNRCSSRSNIMLILLYVQYWGWGHFFPLRSSRYLIFRVLYDSSFQRNSNYYNLKIGVFESSPVQFSSVYLLLKWGYRSRGEERAWLHSLGENVSKTINDNIECIT